jgi:hypothetical protein
VEKRSRKISERRSGSIILAEDLDKMAAKWPTIYLSRISEASKIIKTPDYAAYPRKRTPFTHQGISEGWRFQKVALSVKKEGQWHLKELFYPQRR